MSPLLKGSGDLGKEVEANNLTVVTTVTTKEPVKS